MIVAMFCVRRTLPERILFLVRLKRYSRNLSFRLPFLLEFFSLLMNELICLTIYKCRKQYWIYNNVNKKKGGTMSSFIQCPWEQCYTKTSPSFFCAISLQISKACSLNFILPPRMFPYASVDFFVCVV